MRGGDSSSVYDLRAVMTHIGAAGSGHYTAHARNKCDNKWYTYDDSSVRRVDDESSIQTNAAYVLFYEKRIAPRTPSQPSS